MRFRRNIERIGEVMAYEISKHFQYNTVDVQTPLGVAPSDLYSQQPVVASILRAALPLHQGFLNFFDRGENAFVSAYRHYLNNDGDFEIRVQYIAAPSIEGKTLLLVDPMLATGGSMELSFKALLSHGKPKEVHMAAIVASQQAIDHISQCDFLGIPRTLWVGAIDPEINSHSYIIPGLGDAGDLAYGAKL